MAITQLSSLNSLFNLIYDRARFVAREMNLMTNLVDVRSAEGWMARKLSSRPVISAVAVNENADFTAHTEFGRTAGATLTPGEIHAQVLLTKRALETDPDGAANDAAIELGGALATKMDVDLLGTFASFTVDKGPGANSTCTLATLGAAVAVLTNSKALQFGQPVAVVHPYHWHDWWVELGTPAATYANKDALTAQALRDYFVADLMGVRIYRSANIAVDGNADAISGIFVRPAIMMDVRRAPVFEDEYDPSLRAYELNASAGYAVGIAVDAYGVKYTGDATAP
jgi:hypothetical protein